MVITLEQQISDLSHKYRFKTLLGVRDICNILDWSRKTFYSRHAEGVFHEYGDIPETPDGKRGIKIPKQIVFAYFKTLYK